MKKSVSCRYLMVLAFLISGLLTPSSNAQTCVDTVLNFTNTGVGSAGTTTTWTVPSGGPYKVKITAKGARGGDGFSSSGGNGATVSGEFILQSGQVLQVMAGARGANYYAGGGGGGSGVRIQGGNLLVLAAGGGGGGFTGSNGQGGQVTTGNGNGGNGGTGVTPGQGGGGGGGGFLSNGSVGGSVGGGGGGGGFNGAGGYGGDDGDGGSGANGGGGFGAGGGSDLGGGGGGGYDGGNGGAANTTAGFGGAGGGSYNVGANQANTAGNNSGGGIIVIQCLGAVSFSAAFTATQPNSCNNATQGSLSINLSGAIDGNLTNLEYAIANGNSFSGNPSFSGITADPFAINSGSGTIADPPGKVYTARIRLKYNPALYVDYTYTLNQILCPNSCPGFVFRVTAPTTSQSGTIANWTAPGTGIYKYRIYARGGAGGDNVFPLDLQNPNMPYRGGKGALMSGEFFVPGGQTLNAIAGAPGQNGNIIGAGGGGGSGVKTQSGSPLIIAGGGGGGGYIDASDGTTTTGDGNGGPNSGAGTSGGGGGYYTDGESIITDPNNPYGIIGTGSGGGHGFNGMGGTSCGYPYFEFFGQGGTGGGGFGAGGGACSNGAGGGGYTGGISEGLNFHSVDRAGGGGSYNAGVNQNNLTGGNTGLGGDVLIECLGPATLSASVSAVSDGCNSFTVSVDLTNDLNSHTTDLEYAVVPGSAFSGSPAFLPVTSDPFTLPEGTGTIANSTQDNFTIRIRAKYNPEAFFDQVYSLSTSTIFEQTNNTPNINVLFSEWKIPNDNPYKVKITAKGAKGGNTTQTSNIGGNGAVASGEFIVPPGSKLWITTGAPGGTSYFTGGGGGGSGVQIEDGDLLIIAAGGGGASFDSNGGDAYAPGVGSGYGGYSGSEGGYSSDGAGGGGFESNGWNSNSAKGGSNGFFGLGGDGSQIGNRGGGGFGGGGGGGVYGGGGGGGYGGGNGGTETSAGKGGGSYNNGSNQVNSSGSNAGGGFVSIQCLGPVSVGFTTTPNSPPCGAVQGSVGIHLTGDIAGNTTDLEYAIVSGNTFVGSPTFTSITSQPFTVNSGLGTIADADGETYTVRVRFKFATSAYLDNTYTLYTSLDNTPPTAVCQDITIQLNDNGTAGITADAVNHNSADNCGAITLNLSKYNFNCSDLGSNIVNLTVTDPTSNTSTCQATVTVQDKIAPTLNCKPYTAKLDTYGMAGIIPDSVYQSSSDNCGNVVLDHVTPASFTCADLGINTVTLTVNDGHGNTSTCQATVTVQDKIAPSVTCKSYTANLDINGTASVTPANVFQSGSDNCGTVNLQNVSNESFSCADIGNQTVTLTVNDSHGNTSTCQATVTVQDQIAPTLNCKPYTAKLDAYGMAGIIPDSVYQSSSDNCGNVILDHVAPASFTCADWGPNTVTLTVKDEHGNTSTCQATVTVQDKIAPSVTCKSYTANLDINGTASVTPANVFQSGSDNCGTVNLQNVSTESFSCADIGNQTVTLTVNDSHGNTSTCQATVTIQDHLAPVLACKSYTSYLDVNGSSTIIPGDVTQSSSDNCGGVNVLNVTPASFSCANIGPRTVTLTASDPHGNTSTCQATVNVRDTIAPVLTCPANMTVNCGAAICGANVTVPAPTGFDNCSSLIVYDNATGYYSVGTTTLTRTGTDASGNIGYCTMTIKVIDNRIPNITCPANQSRVAGSVVFPVPTSMTDNCGINHYDGRYKLGTTWYPWVSQNNPSGPSPLNGNYSAGAYTVQYQTFDNNNNSKVCQFSLTITATLTDDNKTEGHLVVEPDLIRSDPRISTASTSDLLRAFPNPASEEVYVSLPAEAKRGALMQLINAQGIVVYQERIVSETDFPVILSVASYASGMYWLSVQVDGKRSNTVKLAIINK